MAIYAVASDPDDFDTLVNANQDGANYRLDTLDSRIGYILNGDTEDASYIHKSFSSAQTTFWAHFCYASQYTNYFSTRCATNPVFIKFYSGGVKKLGFRFTTNTSNTLELVQWNGSAWVSVTTAPYGTTVGIPGTNDPWQVDIFIDISGGRVSFYRNQAPVLTVTGVSFIATSFDAIRLSTPSGDGLCYSEVLVADWNTMLSRVVSKAPNGNGNYTEWTGAGYTALDELQAAADYMTSGTANQRQGVTCSSWPALGTSENVEYVQINVASIRDISGPANQNVYWRISATDYNDSDTAVNTSLTKTFRGFATNPATGAAWTPTILNSAEVGVRSRT